MTIRALIVDDEPFTRDRLRGLLAAEADVQVVGECGSGREAVAAIQDNSPDLVFLDISMPDMSGLDVVDAVGRVSIPAVVFVTGHNQYALQAFELRAADFLLKPFDQQRFKQALSQARQKIASTKPAGTIDRRLQDLVDDLEERERYVRRIPVKSTGRIRFIDVSTINWIDAAGNYVRLNTTDGSFLYRETMTALEKKLDPKRFLRIHRSTIVAIDRIQEVELLRHGDYALSLQGGQRLSVSRTHRERVLRLIAGE